MSDVNKAEWQQWKRDKVTKQLVADFLNKRLYLTEGLIEGAFTGDEGRLIAIGRCQGLKDAVTYIIEDFNCSDLDKEDLKNVT